MSKIVICSLEDLKEGEPLLVEAEGLEVAVFKVGREIFVTDDRCTHGPGSLSEGELDGYTIICDFHQGGFDIRTGEPVVPPCLVPVRTYHVELAEGEVRIDPTRSSIACAKKVASGHL